MAEINRRTDGSRPRTDGSRPRLPAGFMNISGRTEFVRDPFRMLLLRLRQLERRLDASGKPAMPQAETMGE